MSMHINVYITALLSYGLGKGLFAPCDKALMTDGLLRVLQLDSFEPAENRSMPLEEILQGLVEDAVARGVCGSDSESRDLLDAALMGVITPPPEAVRRRFFALYEKSPEEATAWYYRFSRDTNYIRRYRVQEDMRWKAATEYGNLDVTVNLRKPEKEPRADAAMPAQGAEHEEGAGGEPHAPQPNHRCIPIALGGEAWNLQYSPYGYYPEHCIVFNSKHTPLVISKGTFEKLLDFTAKFPHYFAGSHADLPIVGGSRLSHEYFLGGRFSFPMERAPVETKLTFRGFESVSAGIVKWPMSVIRLRGSDRAALCDLADRILSTWRGYTDEEAFIYAETDGVPHNTVTPIARRRGEDFELDLVLRSNITTHEHPIGVFHPHSELHHIKKENIGLVEVMGLAVLPPRLKQELEGIKDAILNNLPLRGELAKHEAWVNELLRKQMFTPENTASILKLEIGKVFAQVLEHAGVYKRTGAGAAAFARFIGAVNARS